MTSKIKPRPQLSDEKAAAFIGGAPDATRGAPSVAPAPAPTRPAAIEPTGGRKTPISLTIPANILADMDSVAKSLGISRASAFSLAAARFIAQEKKGG